MINQLTYLVEGSHETRIAVEGCQHKSMVLPVHVQHCCHIQFRILQQKKIDDIPTFLLQNYKIEDLHFTKILSQIILFMHR